MAHADVRYDHGCWYVVSTTDALLVMISGIPESRPTVTRPVTCSISVYLEAVSPFSAAIFDHRYLINITTLHVLVQGQSASI